MLQSELTGSRDPDSGSHIAQQQAALHSHRHCAPEMNPLCYLQNVLPIVHAEKIYAAILKSKPRKTLEATDQSAVPSTMNL